LIWNISGKASIVRGKADCGRPDDGRSIQDVNEKVLERKRG
jgi:hypothetical protein